MKITTAIIPAAGYGTRFLPITQSIPKEMLPLLNTPAIQTVVTEGIASGINRFIFITGKHKSILASYLSPDEDLIAFLRAKHKEALIEPTLQLIAQAHYEYLEQKNPRGLGDAIAQAQNACTNQFVGVMLPDDILVGPDAALGQLIAIAQEKKGSVIAVQEVEPQQVSSYGIIDIQQDFGNGFYQVASMVEKPQPEQAPSRLAIIGRYVLSPTIFKALHEIRPSHGGELQLTDAIARLITHYNEPVFAYKVKATRYDIGTPVGWLKANIAFGLEHPECGKEIRDFINSQK